MKPLSSTTLRHATPSLPPAVRLKRRGYTLREAFVAMQMVAALSAADIVVERVPDRGALSDDCPDLDVDGVERG